MPYVTYHKCCDGCEPVAVDGDWGLFCVGESKTTDKKCYAAGERAIGASRKPYVTYLKCCSGDAPVAVS
jgi:hypothetical protein